MFFVWNILTTWWIVYASLFGAVMAVVFNSLFMALTFHLYHLSKKLIYKHKQGIFLLVIFWLGFEYLHLNWELSWTWLTLGNGFARWHQIVQWYEFTGVFGGSDDTNGIVSNIERFTFPFDSGTANHIGNLSITIRDSNACNSSTHGFIFMGGFNTTATYSYIDRIQFPFNSGTASTVGNLNADIRRVRGCNPPTLRPQLLLYTESLWNH